MFTFSPISLAKGKDRVSGVIRKFQNIIEELDAGIEEIDAENEQISQQVHNLKNKQQVNNLTRERAAEIKSNLEQLVG